MGSNPTPSAKFEVRGSKFDVRVNDFLWALSGMSPAASSSSVASLRPSLLYALVVQLDRASDFESEWRGFESLRAHHLIDVRGSNITHLATG